MDFELQRFFQVFFRQLTHQVLQNLAVALANLVEFNSKSVLIAVANLALEAHIVVSHVQHQL